MKLGRLHTQLVLIQLGHRENLLGHWAGVGTANAADMFTGRIRAMRLRGLLLFD